eukprot:12590509-Alexandrium_andersonii.AAC.1
MPKSCCHHAQGRCSCSNAHHLLSRHFFSSAAKASAAVASADAPSSHQVAGASRAELLRSAVVEHAVLVTTVACKKPLLMRPVKDGYTV